MWKSLEEKLENGIVKYKISINDKPINYREWIRLLKESSEFVEFFTELLKASKYEGFFWEVKPINEDKINEDFEFVLMESKIIQKIEADNSSFKKYFEKGKSVVTFPNLRGDAQLIVPTDVEESSSCYGHLAKFIRKAPKLQVIKFWKKVGQEYEKSIGEKTTWLSTAGLGIYWLHVRIDSTPKYYRYTQYKRFK